MQPLEHGLRNELKPDDRFNFECTDKCMGKCCRFLTILLDPWDVEVIAREIDISGPDFLEIFCNYEFGSASQWPFVWLRQAEVGPCAFLLEDGRCSVYSVRPRNCRTYPIGRAVQFREAGRGLGPQEKLFIVERPEFCLGHEGTRTWTVSEWLRDSAADKYHELSDLYLSLIDYASGALNCRTWLTKKTSGLLMPLLFLPDVLRTKLGVSKNLDHESFYRRRIEATKVLLTEMAASFGQGPMAGAKTVPADENTPVLERIRQIIFAD